MTTTDSQPRESSPDGPRRGEHFYQGLLDSETRDVAVSLRATSPGFLDPGGIAPARYFSPEFHRLEVEHVWKRTWQMACREEQVAEAGDTYVYEVADVSLIITRTDAGEIRAYHNSCLHRGTQLRVASGPVGEFRCPYHGFTWNLDGELSVVPSEWDFPGLDVATMCLPQAAVGTWGGFVFVNPDPDAGPLDEYLEVLPEHFATWPLGERCLKAHIVRTVPCNWKIALEAFIESYHVMAVHPQLLKTAAESLTQYDIYGPHVSRMVTAVGIGSEHLADAPAPADIVKAMLGPRGDVAALDRGATAREVVAEGVRASLKRRTGRDFSAVSDAEILDGIEYFLFPNFMPWGGLLTSFAYTFRPAGNDPESCIVEIMVLEPVPEGQVRPTAARTRVLNADESWIDVPELGVFGRVFNQDGGTFARVQRGLRASVRPATTLSSYQESRIRHMHATLDMYIDKGSPSHG